jgi:indolepyruvate ferredoxin oxidoreductase beta subunit
MKKQDIFMVGVGGQGIILASDILGEVALAVGYDVKKTDTLGMAQRGGSVVSHVRIAEQVWSPLIKEGEADILLAFEKLEAARWGYYLRPGGIAIVNNHAIPPLSVSLGTHRYPGDEEIEDILKRKTGCIYFVDGTSKAKELGEIRALNMFMLGCVSWLFSVDVHTWKKCMAQRIPSKILQINVTAFDQGRKEASDVNLG